MDTVTDILQYLENCYLPKLSQNLEERENHPEFKQWELQLEEYFPKVIKLLNDPTIYEHNLQSSVLSSIILLYFQLVSKGKWNTAECGKCAISLDCQLDLLYETTCTNFFKTNKVEKSLEVFEKCMEVLHQKLSPDDFKKYPALIEAYCLILKDIQDYHIVLKPLAVLPVSLLLIEDYIKENRIKGLNSCLSILKSLRSEHFKIGNYYEVIYRILKKAILERDIEVTKLALDCLFKLLQILPLEAKVSTVDDALSIILEQTYMETNLYRKKDLFCFIHKIIPIHEINCAKMSIFLTVICDNLDICSNGAVAEILLRAVLECLQNWIIHCWCVWKLKPNKKLMAALIKNLYISCKEEDVAGKIETIFIALCQLSTEAEQKEIYDNIETSIENYKTINETFVQKLENIKRSII